MNRLFLTAVAAATLLLVGCATTAPAGPSASAQLMPTKGNSVTGQVLFVQKGDKVLVSGEIRGLAPNTEHGFHIHDKGDCSSGDGMSTGGHFNPDNKPHGDHDHGEHHAGDLPSLKADASGIAHLNFESGTITLVSGKTTDILGHGLIVHRDPDDYKTQPTGNSGPRLACAVITQN